MVAKENYIDFINFIALIQGWKDIGIVLNQLTKKELEQLIPFSQKNSLVGSKANGLLELNLQTTTTKPVYSPQPSKQKLVEENRFNISSEATDYLKIYPNPAQQQFTVDYKIIKNTDSKIYIRLVNVTGQFVYQHITQKDEDRLVVNIENMPTGIYFCQLIVGDTILFNDKINIFK